MADASYKNASQLVSLVGANSSGLETNFVNADANGRLLVSPDKHEPTTFTIIAESISLGNNKSLCSVVSSDSNPVFIKEVWITLSNSQNFPNVQVNFKMFRITSHTGGTSLSALAHDTADTLPSVTIKTGSTVSGEASSPLESTWWASYDLLFGGQSSYAAVEHALANQMPYWNQTPGTKPIAIRNGEGLHIKCASNVSDSSFTIRFVCSY